MAEVEVVREHESFGQIEFSRIQTNKAIPLYGSSINSSNMIRMRVYQSEERRGLKRFWFFPKNTLIEVDMSVTQFSEAITNMNRTGIPCTIRSVVGQTMSAPPVQSIHNIFNMELKKDIYNIMANATVLMAAAKDILTTTGAITKQNKERLLNLISGISQDVLANLPFFHKSLVEQMNASASEVKTELDAHVTHMVTKLGQEVLKDKYQLDIPEYKDNFIEG